MPIRGLTGRQPQFPEIGQLRKGAPKPNEKQPGKDLTYFRFTSEVEGAEDAFRAAYGDEPSLVNVFLPFRSVDENMDAWQEEWVASGLKHRCDGEYVVRMQNEKGEYVDPEYGTVPCPGGCKPAARLRVVIPELKRLAYVTVLTTSVHDIANLDSQLRALYAIQQDLRGIPLQLRRSPHKISAPASGGKRARREKWLLSIEAAPRWVDLQLEAQQAAALPQLPSGVVVEASAPIVDHDTGEILGGEWDEDAFDAGEEMEEDVEEGEFTEEENPQEPATADASELPIEALAKVVPSGKYKGWKLGDLLGQDVGYVEWMAMNLKGGELKAAAIAALGWPEADDEPQA